MFHVFLRVAIDAPGHSQRRNTGNTVHRFYLAMTFLTFNVCQNMSLVRKVNEIGYIVNLNPGNRFAVLPIGRQLDNFRPFADVWQGLVTPYAFIDAWNASGWRRGCVYVAVLARNLIVRYVHRVTKLDWLNRAAVREIFALYPCAHKQSEQRH